MENSVLITITSCNRLTEIKKYIFPYINFVNKNDGFSFLLALDGHNLEYIEFCYEYNIPLLYSEEREGVGLSKNRILEHFPNFDHYFFIDDDVELIDDSIFSKHIELGKSHSEFYHLSTTNLFNIEETSEKNNLTLIYGFEGGGYFNYFNKKGLDSVGGWHTNFATYRRYGHTEHSYRFYTNGFTKYPFTIIKDCINMLLLHNPEHVTEPIEGIEQDLFPEEKKLIEQKIKFFPITTLSNYQFNNFDIYYNEKVDDFLKLNKQNYPLIHGITKFRCLSDLYFFKFLQTNNNGKKFLYFGCALFLSPLNPEIKHWIKIKLKRI